MGCGGSKDVVVELPQRRRSSASISSVSKLKGTDELFSRPGSGPTILSPSSKGHKNRVGIENNTYKDPIVASTASPRIRRTGSRQSLVGESGDTPNKCITVLPKIEQNVGKTGTGVNVDLRKGSAHSKASQDSGIGLGLDAKPLSAIGSKSQLQSSSPRLLPSLDPRSTFVVENGVLAAAPSSGGEEVTPVPRLASEDILSQLNEIGIVPLRTNRCGSSLAFNIDIEQTNNNNRSQNSSENVSFEASAASDETGPKCGPARSLPPLPPSRIQRLQQLPPLQPSLEQLEAKQKKAEQRRKNREEKVRHKSEQLRNRRVSEAELTVREGDLKEKFSQEIQQKHAQNELNKQKLKEQQEEKKRKNEERLRKVKMNKEKLALSGVGGYGDTGDAMESSRLETCPTDREEDHFDSEKGQVDKERENAEMASDSVRESSATSLRSGVLAQNDESF